MSMGLALLCWVIGGVVSLLGGLCFAELGASDPKSGGMVVYMDKAYHPAVGYSFGFTSWLVSGSGSIAALAIALATALNNFVDLSGMQVKLIAIILIIALTAYNCLGIKMGSILQNVSMIAKMIPIAIILFAALMINTLMEDPVTACIGLVVPALGVLTWFLFDKRLKKETQNQEK